MTAFEPLMSYICLSILYRYLLKQSYRYSAHLKLSLIAKWSICWLFETWHVRCESVWGREIFRSSDRVRETSGKHFQAAGRARLVWRGRWVSLETPAKSHSSPHTCNTLLGARYALQHLLRQSRYTMQACWCYHGFDLPLQWSLLCMQCTCASLSLIWVHACKILQTQNIFALSLVHKVQSRNCRDNVVFKKSCKQNELLKSICLAALLNSNVCSKYTLQHQWGWFEAARAWRTENE